MIILCEYCDIRCTCYDDWIEHLLNERHQETVSEAIHSWDASLNERSLVVTINGTKPNKSDLCWYFANYGLVADVFFGNNLEFCVIQLDKKDYVINAVSVVEHYMEKATLNVRLRTEISDAEWLILTSMVRRTKNGKKESCEPSREYFETRHSKLSDILKSIPIDSQMDHFGREAKMKSGDICLRESLLNDITLIFKKDFTQCILYPFGSFVTGLGNSSSVLYIYFDATGESVYKRPVGERRLLSNKDIANSFQKSIENINRTSSFCYAFTTMPHEVMPCAKFTHYGTGVTCKFTFDSLHPVQTSKLIALIMKLDSRLPNLFLFLRYWAEYYELTGEHLISKYSLSLLILVFLTKKKIIPSVSVLQTMSNSSQEVNGWEMSFCDDTEKIINLMSFFGSSSTYDKNPTTGNPSAQSILILTAEFCKMYAHTDLQSQVVCPAIGDFLPKSAFDVGKENELPKSLDAYKNRLVSEISTTGLNTSGLLCIQDPFDLTSNVSISTPQSVVWNFQFACADTVDLIQGILESENPNMMDIFKSQSKTKNEHRDSTTTTNIPLSSSPLLLPMEQPPNSPKSKTNQHSSVTIQLSEENRVPLSVARKIKRGPPEVQNTSSTINTKRDSQAPNNKNQNPPVLASFTESPSSSSRSENHKVVETFVSTTIPSITSYNMSPLPLNYVLKFGDVQRLFKIPVENGFERTFKEHVGNLVSDSSTNTRMNILWCTFLKDCLFEIWWRSFLFEVSDVTHFNIPINKGPKGNDEIMTYSLSVSSSENDSPAIKRPKIEGRTVKYKFEPRANPHKQQFFNISTNFVYNKAFLCTFNKTFAVGRGPIRTSAWLTEPDLPKQFNPLDMEAEITRRNYNLQLKNDSACKCQLVAKISVDFSSKERSVATLAIKNIKSDSKAREVNPPTVEHIISVIRDLIPKYQAYRLNGWLESNFVVGH